MFPTIFAQNSANTVSQHTNPKHCVQHSDSAHKHGKKCAFGVFLKYTRYARISKCYVTDFICLNGAQGRNRTTDTRIFNTPTAFVINDLAQSELNLCLTFISQNEVIRCEVMQPHQLDAHLCPTIIVCVDVDHRVVFRSARIVELLEVDITLI